MLQLLGSSNDGTRVIYVDLKAEDSTYKTMTTPTVEFVDKELPEDDNSETE